MVAGRVGEPGPDDGLVAVYRYQATDRRAARVADEPSDIGPCDRAREGGGGDRRSDQDRKQLGVHESQPSWIKNAPAAFHGPRMVGGDARNRPEVTLKRPLISP